MSVVSLHKKIIRSTPFGPVGMMWAEIDGRPRIVRILISTPLLPADKRTAELYPYAGASGCPEIDAVAAEIRAFLEGEPVFFSLDAVDLDRCAKFQRRVLKAEQRIPRGTVSSYQLIARHLGKADAARAVGNALANNPFPLIVPCHRAIRTDRLLGGFQGGLEMKRALLANEGVSFDDSGRVVCERFHYE